MLRSSMRPFAALFTLILSVSGLALFTADAAVSLPACPPTSLTKTGNQTSGINQGNNAGTWDLRGAVWNENAPDPTTYPIRSESWTKGCIIGGKVLGNVPKDWTRDQWYNATDGGKRLGGEVFRQTMTSTSGNWLLIRDAYAEDYEDAYDPNAASSSATTYLDHVHAKYIRDDCVENEMPVHNLVIKDTLFDGCFTAFAMRPSGASTAQNGSTNASFTVEDSLVYVQPQPLGSKYCDSGRVSSGRCKVVSSNKWLGAYGIWKWSNQAPKNVTVRNTIFRLDMPSYSSCSSQQWPAGTYENVTLVWTGSGSYSSAGGCSNKLPAGVTLTTDVSVWNKAKDAWLNGSAAPAPSGSGSTATASPSPTATSSPSPTATASPTTQALRLVCPTVESPKLGQQVTCTYEAQ